jgi:hypothetical protein
MRAILVKVVQKQGGGGVCGNCGSYSNSFLRDLVWGRSGEEKEVDFEGSRTPVHILCMWQWLQCSWVEGHELNSTK